MNVIAFAAPYLAPQFHLDKLMMGKVFSIGLAGTMVGGFLFGYLGDKIGRRPAIILATAAFSILTMAIAFAGGKPSRPIMKGLSDVARLLHRDDLANLQYGLKKLLSLGFIEKASDGASRRNTTYVPTESGRAIVDAYLQHRRDTLVRLVGSMSGTQEALQQATSILHVMTGLYDQASTILSSQIGDVPGLRP